MAEVKKARQRVTAHVSRAQAAQEAEAMTNGKGRSRWIATLIVVAILALGGWVIAQRIMPHAFSNTTVRSVINGGPEFESSQVGYPSFDSESSFAARVDVPMVKSAGMAIAPEMDMMVTDEVMGMDESYDDEGMAVMPDRKIQRTGDMSITVDSITWTIERVGEIAHEFGGDVMSTNFYTNKQKQVAGVMRIRVKTENFDNVFEKIKKEVASFVESENTNAQDVTEQYTDLEAQLKNKRNTEEALTKVLERAGDMDDVLKVTRELSRVRGEIERIEGRLRYMDARTDFSFITLHIEEDEKIVTPDTAWRPGTVARQSINRLIADAQQLTDKVIQFLTWFVPAFFLYVLVIVVLWSIVKRVGMIFIKRWERRQKEKDIQ